MAGSGARERIRDQRRRQRSKSVLIWGGLGVALIALIIVLVRPRTQPSQGEAVPVMESSAHVQQGTDPGPYNSDPPTSGRHYDNSLPAGFYDESDLPEFEPYPAGFLVHSLEHGYVIFWYNCDLLSDGECSSLQEQMRGVMAEAEDFKVIAFPWTSIEVPVVMTSWGQMLRMDRFDPATALQFVRTNRNRAPEPQAP
jgi:hypothetical protein